jgi:hypothetical protein
MAMLPCSSCKIQNPFETWLNDENFRRMTHYTPHEVHWLPINLCVIIIEHEKNL